MLLHLRLGLVEELPQDNRLDLDVAPDQTVDEAQLLPLVYEIDLDVLVRLEPDEHALLPVCGHLKDKAPPIHKCGDLGDLHALRNVRAEVAKDLIVGVGHLPELLEALRRPVPLEGLLQADDDLGEADVDDLRHRLDGDGGHVAEELSDLLVGVQDEEDGADGREAELYAEIRFLLHFGGETSLPPSRADGRTE